MNNTHVQSASVRPKDHQSRALEQGFRVSLKKWLYGGLDTTKSIDYSNTEDYLYLPEHQSAKRLFLPITLVWGLALLAFVGIVSTALNYLFGLSYLLFFSSSIALFYLFLMLFKVWVIWQASTTNLINYTYKEVQAINDAELPTISVLIPLYQEAEVIEQIFAAMGKVDYPKDKLDVMITLEMHDHETREAIATAGLPSYFRIVDLPSGKGPQSKPKAMNVAFPTVKSDLFVIYDAELIPDSDQLKKAYLAFRDNPDIHCLQTRLDHYNRRQNVITRLFNAEFSFHYDLFLVGIQKYRFPIPLSGHSVIFRTHTLHEVGAWDPYNVAEDCEAGIRLYRHGYKTALLDSLSREEATSDVDSWIKQRTRWMKGFIQTSVVHLREPIKFYKEIGGFKNFLVFFLSVPGTVAVNIINLFSWILLITWFVFEPSFIKALFPGFILGISLASFLIGNFIFTYFNLVGSHRRGHFDLVKYSLLSPLYWFMLSVASTRAVIQVFTNPHKWEKTKHGTHLESNRA